MGAAQVFEPNVKLCGVGDQGALESELPSWPPNGRSRDWLGGLGSSRFAVATASYGMGIPLGLQVSVMTV